MPFLTWLSFFFFLSYFFFGWGGLPERGWLGWDREGPAELGAARLGSRLAHSFLTEWEPGSQPAVHLIGIAIATFTAYQVSGDCASSRDRAPSPPSKKDYRP